MNKTYSLSVGDWGWIIYFHERWHRWLLNCGLGKVVYCWVHEASWAVLMSSFVWGGGLTFSCCDFLCHGWHLCSFIASVLLCTVCALAQWQMLWAPQRVTLCTMICTVSGCSFTALTGYRMFPCHTHVPTCVFIFCCIPHGVVRRCAFCLWPVGYAFVQTPWRRGSFALISQGDAASFPSAISEKFTKPECHTLCHTYLKSISWILIVFLKQPDIRFTMAFSKCIALI